MNRPTLFAIPKNRPVASYNPEPQLIEYEYYPILKWDDKKYTVLIEKQKQREKPKLKTCASCGSEFAKDNRGNCASCGAPYEDK